MKFVHSFQASPLLNQKFNSLEQSLKIILVNYAYSVECIHKFGNTIELYTDKLGEEILKVIPYDKIHIVENNITDNYHFAASIKFEALKRMSLSEILIDGDIFLEKNLVFNIIKNLNSDIVVSLYEPRELIFKKENVIDLFNYYNIPTEDDYPLDTFEKIDGWYNTSLLKFNNQDTKNEYIRQYISHVKKAQTINFKGEAWPDIVYEQYNITNMLKNNNWTISAVQPKYGKDDIYPYKIGFCHLGALKQEGHSYYLRQLQTINFQLFKDIEKHYKYLMNLYTNF